MEQEERDAIAKWRREFLCTTKEAFIKRLVEMWHKSEKLPSVIAIPIEHWDGDVVAEEMADIFVKVWDILEAEGVPFEKVMPFIDAVEFVKMTGAYYG